MRKCITHHFSCDCREEKIQYICRWLRREHDELKNFLSGFGKKEPCDCPACEAIRELYGEELCQTINTIK